MKISVLHRGRLFFSLGNLFFPIYYYIFVIVNYGKDIRLRRIGLGNSSNLMKYRDKLFSPMAGHAFMVCLARWITKGRRLSNPVFRSFIASFDTTLYIARLLQSRAFLVLYDILIRGDIAIACMMFKIIFFYLVLGEQYLCSIWKIRVSGCSVMLSLFE